jgi:adenylate kinase
MKIVLIGPSGAGKGSLAEFIVRDNKIPHISTGQFFRDNIAEKTPLGLEAEKYVNNGILVPDEITVKMLLVRLEKKDCGNGFVLDGFPRTLKQAELLAKKIDIDYAVEINASDETVIERLGGRYMCQKCGTIHNVRFDNVKECKSCGHTEFYQREDDREEKILKRLEQYHAQSAPLLAFYRGQGKLITVNSNIQDRPENLYAKFLDLLGGVQ